MDKQEILLVEPAENFETEFLAMAEEYRASGDTRYQSALENFPGYLERLSRSASEVNLPPDRVPESEFWLVCDNRVIGRGKLRHRLNSALEHEGGHIAYDICPSERRKGYGSMILRLILQKAKDAGLNRVLLTCDADNFGSIGVIENNNGVLSGRAVSHKNGKPILQYWIEL